MEFTAFDEANLVGVATVVTREEVAGESASESEEHDSELETGHLMCSF